MFKHFLLSGLTLVSPILVTASNAHAELAPGIDTLTIKTIQRSKVPVENNNNRNNSNNSNTRVATNSQRSMQYVRQGLSSQKRGDEKQALLYYYKALKLDKTNAVAFMAAGNLLGESEEGIACMRAAATLFRQQENREGYDLAMGWLQERGAAE
jgi:Cohesin loading factor